MALRSAPAMAEGDYFPAPRAAYDPAVTSTQETIVLAGGCFWGVQAVYQRINGVESAVSGYAGGAANTATYAQTGTGTTGHAEAVEIVYNPEIISAGEILRIFFSVVHDPTQLDRQGPDWGPQYRSHIYTTTDEQAEVAARYIAQLSAAGIYSAPIVTRLDPLPAFYPAEGYHQDYLLLHPNQPYIVINDIPKVENTYTYFNEYWRDPPITVATTRPELVR
ncbi:MAG: peptide-methionine (S)-S-oxide reductase MsrA [Bauldia sp.]|nr:peptide-methionine (S)-S-oxide reductase MsrA [Bauldia sp.]MCW5718708.1 peptide-methionine (S)-S-oxide reductase MsrA [Bauldia sp.]